MSAHLHPSVREFKAFLQKHPRLIKEIRKNNQNLQQFYEKWALLGEDDPFWDRYKENSATQSNTKEKGSGEWLEKLVKMSEKIDMDMLQNQVQNLSETISTVQGLINQFQYSDYDDAGSENQQDNTNLFHVFKD